MIKRILKWFTISIVSILLLLVIAGFCITNFFGKEVINLIVGELNKNLNVEIRVGAIDFTVFKRFPDASIEFTDVIAFSSKNIEKQDFSHNADTLLIAKKLFLQFDVWDIIDKRYKIKAVHLENAYVQILMDSKGENNFQVLKDTASGAQSDTASLSLNLKKVSIKNSAFVFDDRASQVLSRNRIHKIAFSGNFKDEDFILKSKASLTADELTIGSKKYLNHNLVEYDIELNVHKKQFEIASAELGLKNIQIALTGDMDFTAKPRFNLQFDISKFQIQAMLPYLPTDVQQKLQTFQLQGKIKTNGTFRGSITETTLPALELHFAIEKAQLSYNKQAIALETEGLFKTKNLAQAPSFLLVLDTVWASHRSCSYSGHAMLSNFDKLDLQTSGQVFIDLAQLHGLLNLDKNIQLQGTLESPITFTGRLSDLDSITNSDLQSIILKNKLQLHNVSVKTSDGFAINNVNGGCVIESNKNLLIDSLDLQYKNIVVRTSGTVNNLLPYILFSNESMRADLQVHTSCIDFDDLSSNNNTSPKQSTDSSASATTAAAASKSGLGIPQGVVAVIKLEADCFVSNKLSLKEVKTNLTLTSSEIIAESCNFKTMGGKVQCDLLLQQNASNGFTLKTTANINNVQADKIFYSFENFDQDFLTDKNIKGTITAKLTFFTDLNAQFDVDTKSMYAECSATIQNGQLNHFEPMRKMSQFIELSELENVSFKTLKNDFLIKNETLFIPKMDIVSNAFELSVIGEQSFSGNFDYHLKVLLNDMLNKKRKKQKPQDEFGEVEDDGLGRIRLPIHIFGNTDKIEVKPDYKAVKEDIKESLIQERNELSRIFKEEFNLSKKDTVIKQQPEKKPKDPEKFQIQWDD